MLNPGPFLLSSRACCFHCEMCLHFREYCKSGCLNLDYLRFLWMHRKIDPPGPAPGPAIGIADLEFESIISTMTRLLVMYRVRGGNSLVVPARLPEYGNQDVLDSGNITELVVEIRCSFGQIYPPPGIIGRFLAWLTDVDYYGECWQHGAFLRYSKQDVFFYESEDWEPHEDGTESKFAGMTLGVQAEQTEAREVLTKLKESLEELVSDSAYGYPGLTPLMYFEEPVETKSKELRELRRRLDNTDEKLERIGRKLDRVANQVAEQLLFAASATRRKSPYPRLVILVPEDEESGTQGRIQRAGWGRWREAWKKLEGSVELNNKFRLRFLCEYNLTEVPCGPDGRGYLIKQTKDWVNNCVPLMQVSVNGNSVCFRARLELTPGRHQAMALFRSSVRFTDLGRVASAIFVLLLCGVPVLDMPSFRGPTLSRETCHDNGNPRVKALSCCPPSPRNPCCLISCLAGFAMDLAVRSWHGVTRGPAHERSAGGCREDGRWRTGGRHRHGGSLCHQR